MSNRILRFSILAIGVFAAVAPALGQEEVWRYFNVKDSVVVEAERVTQIPTYHSIATKVPISLQRTPASIGVVTQSLFTIQDGTVLGDALKNVSGINVQSNFGVHDYFLIRGFDSLTNGLVLTDGTAEPEATFYNLHNIERIEVLKGPSAFLYGGNPLSGTVNLVRKRPTYTNFSRFSGSFGHFNTLRGTADINVTNPQSGVSFRFNGLYQQSDNYRDDKKSDMFSVNPAITWQVGRQSAITANVEFIDSQFKPDSGIPLLLLDNKMSPVPRETSYQSPFDLSDQQVVRAQVDFNTKISESFSLQSKTYFTDLKWDSRGTLILGAAPDPFTQQLQVNRTFLDLDDRQKLFGTQLEGLFTFATGSVEHALLTGLEFVRHNDDFALNVALLPPMEVENPVETAARPLTVVLSSLGDAGSDVLAPYFVNKITFLDKCTVFLGGRLDVIDYEDKATATRRNYEKFSPMFGFGYAPTDELSFYGNVGQAFAPPSTRVVGDRDPEESTQIEVGAKQRFMDGKVNATAALYQIKKKNIAIPDDNGVTQQNGNQRSRGVEFELSAQVQRGLLAFVAYAYTDAELTDFRELLQVGIDGNFMPIFSAFDRSGNRSAFAPEHILNVWFTKVFPSGFGLGAGGRYLSSQYIAEDNRFKIDPSLTLDAAIFYQAKRWKYSLNFKNLTDTEHEMRGFSTGSVLPANPFSVYTAFEFSL